MHFYYKLFIKITKYYNMTLVHDILKLYFIHFLKYVNYSHFVFKDCLY